MNKTYTYTEHAKGKPDLVLFSCVAFDILAADAQFEAHFPGKDIKKLFSVGCAISPAL